MGLSEEARTAMNPQVLQERWQQLSNRKKISVVILVVAVFTTVFFLIQAASRPRMAPLFSGLDAADAGRIAGKLHEMGVAYTLENEGRTILVRQDKVYDVRIQMAGDASLIGGGTGFELFDQAKLGATDFNRRMDYLRALQEEIRRTIVQLEEVEQARVHLTLPEPSVFIQESAEASAAIVLRLRPYARLKPEQIRGIVYLIAGSVEKLSPEQVTVLDTQGNILSDMIEGQDPSRQLAEATLLQMDVKRSFEKEIEQRVQRMLERVLGPGQAIAMMTAELDFDSREATIITFGTEGVPRSQTFTRETFEGSGVMPGEAGTDSNIPGYPVYMGSGESQYERYDEIINYEINETTERQIQAPGQLVRLHAAVVVNDNGGQLTQAQLAQIREVVESAIGYQDTRGDSISVQGMNFDTTHLDEAKVAMEEAQRREQIRLYSTVGATLLAVFIVLFTVMRSIRARRERELEEQLAAIPQGLDVEIDDIPVEKKPPTDEQILHRRVRQMAEKEPEAVAYLLRAWLADE